MYFQLIDILLLCLGLNSMLVECLTKTGDVYNISFTEEYDKSFFQIKHDNKELRLEIDENEIDVKKDELVKEGNKIVLPINAEIEIHVHLKGASGSCIIERSVGPPISSEFSSCEKEPCSIGSITTVTKCNDKKNWILDKNGEFYIKISSEISSIDQIVTVYMFLHVGSGISTTTTTTPRKLSVEYSPTAKSACTLIYAVGTTISMKMLQHTQDSVYLLHVNNELKNRTNSEFLSYTFTTADKFTLSISLENTASTWRLEVTVKKRNLKIDFQPRIGQSNLAIETMKNMTFLVTYADPCLVTTNTSYKWLIDNKQVYVGSTFIHVFPLIGKFSLSMPIQVKDYTEILHISLYDRIEGFSVTLNTLVCLKKNLRSISPKIAQGSAVRYKYRIDSNGQFNDVPNEGIDLSMFSTGGKVLNFRAENVVSFAEFNKSVTLKDNTDFKFTTRYIRLGQTGNLRVQNFVSCFDYFYKWTIDSVSPTDWIKRDYDVIPLFSRTFISNKEESYNVNFEMKFDSNKTKLMKSAIFYVEQEIILIPAVTSQNILKDTPVTVYQEIEKKSTYLHYKWNNNAYQISTQANFSITKSFDKEGEFKEIIYLKNNVSSKTITFTISVQNQLQFQLSQENFKALINQQFEITISFTQSSIFGFDLQIEDDKNLNSKVFTKGRVFIFKHTYSTLGSYTLTFTASSKLETIKKNATIEVGDPVFDFQATVSKQNIIEGEKVFIDLNAFTTNQRDLSFIWQVTQSTSDKVIYLTRKSDFSYQFNNTGLFTISLTASNGFANVSRTFNITVLKAQINMKIFAEFNGKRFEVTTNSSKNIETSLNEIISFTAVIPSLGENTLKWYVDGQLQPGNNEQKVFNMNFTRHDIFKIKAVSTFSNLLEWGEFVVKIPLAVQITSFIMQLDQIDLVNNSYAFTKETSVLTVKEIQFNNQVDQSNLNVQVSCVLNETLTIINKTTKLSQYKNIDGFISKRDGVLRCAAVLQHVTVDETTFNVVYNLVTNYPDIEFINSPNTLSDNAKPRYFSVKITDSYFDGTFLWFLDDKNKTDCISNFLLSAKQEIYKCQHTFENSGQYMWKVEFKTKFFNVAKTLPVYIIDEITNIELRPSIAIVNTPVNISVITNTDVELKYQWDGFNSNKSYVTFISSATGNKSVTVTVSNPINSVKHSQDITIFPQFDDVSLSIISPSVNNSTVKVGETITLESSLIDSMLNYNWQIISVKKFSNQDLGPGYYQVTPEDAGDFIVNLTVTSPFKAATNVLKFSSYSEIDDSIDIRTPTIYNVKNVGNDRVIYVPTGSHFTLEISNFNSAFQYQWQAVPPDVISETKGNAITLSLHDNNINETLITLKISSTPHIFVFKKLKVIIRKPVKKLNFNDGIFTVKSDTNYILNVTYAGDGDVYLNQFSITNVVSGSENYTIFKNYIEITFKSLPGENSVTVEMVLCNEYNCQSKNWNINAKPEVKTIKALPSNSVVSFNSTVVLTVQEEIEKTDYSWFIVLDSDKKCPFSDNLSPDNNNKIDCPIGKGVPFMFTASALFDPGNYTIKLISTGPLLENGEIESMFVIKIDDCLIPNVNLIGSNNREHMKSKSFYSAVNITSQCSVRVQWKFYRVDSNSSCNIDRENNDEYKIKLLPGLNLTFTNPSLEVPSRAFETGYYCVQCQIKYGKNDNGMFVGLRLYVFGTPLVPLITGGEFRVTGSEQETELDASTSIDPDVLYPNTPDLVYQWQSQAKACLHGKDGIDVNEFSIHNKIVSIKPNCLVSFNDYFFKLFIKRREDQLANAVSVSQQIYVMNGTVPLIEITCKTCSAFKMTKYIRSNQLRLVARCTNCGRLKSSFQWNIQGKFDHKYIELNNETVLNEVNTNFIILAPNVLDGLQPYLVSVNMSVEGMEGYGVSTFLLNQNLGPENGTCFVSPTFGTYGETLFEVSCDGWQDIDNINQPFIYSILVNNIVMSRNIQTQTKTKLQVGDLKNNYSLNVEIRVEDSLGTYTVAYLRSIQVKASQKAKEDAVSFLEENIVPGLKRSSESQDLNLVVSDVVACTKLIDEETQSPNRSQLITLLMNSAASLRGTSEETISQLTSAMQFVTRKSKVNDIDRNARETSSNSIINVLSLASSFLNEGRVMKLQLYDDVMTVLSSQLEFYFTKHEGNTRKRRSLHSEDSIDYRMVQETLDIVLEGTIPGEKQIIFNTKVLIARLLRGKGSNAMGTSHDTCSVNANISSVYSIDDVSKIETCSVVDPFTSADEEKANYVVSYSLKNENLTELSFSGLAHNEEVIVNVPSKTNSSIQYTIENNESKNILINGKEIVVFEMQNFSSTLNENIGLHIMFKIKNSSILESSFEMSIYLAVGQPITLDSKGEVKATFGFQSDVTSQTLFIFGRDYDASKSYYIGIEHNSDISTNITMTTFFSSCIYWNTTLESWENNGCYPTNETTLNEAVCRCNHLTAFSSNFELKPNPIQLENLLKLDISDNPVVIATCIVLLCVYLIAIILAYRKDKHEQEKELLVPFIGSDDGFYQYEIRIKTGVYPFAGTTAKVGIQIFGTSCTTKARVIQTSTSFQRNALDMFRISLDRSIGKVHKIRVWHDNSGNNPSWFVERIVIRSLVNGEKFFFFCNRQQIKHVLFTIAVMLQINKENIVRKPPLRSWWLGPDSDDGKVEVDFHVADTKEIQKFSTIFFDYIGRGFNDFHLWLSLFERPRYSKFTRVQRVTCCFTLVLSWMCVNAMWFEVAPDGKTDIYFGFKGYSFEEVVIGVISVLMVIPLNLFLFFLFRKSRERYVPSQKLKIWPHTRNAYMELVDIPVDSSSVKKINNESTSDVSMYEDDISKVTRKRKCLNIHELMKDEDDYFNLQFPSSYGDNLVLRTSNYASSSTRSSATLMLPKTMESYIREGNRQDRVSSTKSSSSLTLSPRHQFRTSSFRLPSQTNSVIGNSVLKRTRSADSSTFVSQMDAARLMEPRISTDQIRNHLTDIVEHQLSNIFNFNETEESYARLTDLTKEQFYEEPLITMSIRKNEMLAERLQIPDIVELDACTRWTLPFWFTYVAYILCFLISGLSVVIILTYGQQFGEDVSLKWLRALFVGLIQDIFLVYPILVILVAAFTALFTKPLDLDQFDHNDFITCQSGKSIDCTNNEEVHPLSGFALELAQRDALKRKELREFAKVFIFQTFLLWFVIAICWILATDHLYESTKALHKVHVDGSNKTWKKVTGPNEYWNWLEQPFLPSIFNDVTPANWYSVSNPVVRQVRAKVENCIDEKHATMANITNCAMDNYLEDVSFASNWSIVDNNNIVQSPWSYTPEKNLNATKHYGVIDDYPPSGYIWQLDSIKRPKAFEVSMTSLESLKQRYWLDKQTRALLHHYYLFCPAINQYAEVSIVYEMTSSSYLLKTLEVKYFYAYIITRNLDYFFIVCVTLLSLFTIYMIWKCFSAINKHGLKVLKQFWMFHMVLMIITFLFCIILQIVNLFLTLDFQEELIDGHLKRGISARDIAVIQYAIKALYGFLAFLSITRCLKLFASTRVYKFAWLTLNQSCIKSIVGFIFIHILISLIFATSAYLIYQPHIFEFRNFWQSFLNTLFYRWCGSVVDRMIDIKCWFGMLWNILYMLYWIIIMVNMFRAIIVGNGAKKMKIAGDLNKKSSFFTYTWKQLTNRSKRSRRVHFDTEIPNVSDNDEKPQTSTMISCESDSSIQSTDTLHLPPIARDVILPPLPYNTFNLDTDIMSVLTGLDKLASEDQWEEEILQQVERKCQKMTKRFSITSLSSEA